MSGEGTIAAIATGLTDSGIGIIRISGENALSVGNSLFRTPSGKAALINVQSRLMQYGYAVNENDEIIDEVMAVVMRSPKSYTGEDTVEIQCHGGVLVMRKILEASLNFGARLAQPGEFTKRAFLNGRLDLARAEAVMDIISSRSEYALSSSVSQLRGKLSEKVKSLRKNLIYEIAYIESALDDPEHISLDGYGERLSENIDSLILQIKKLLSTVNDGKFIREGIDTVILGKPNVGKSSLLNYLIGEDRAIVTEIAGTTRDVLTEHVTLDGIGLNLVDTAGIRDTEDTVEKIGVDRAKQYAQNADLILYVVDISQALDDRDRDIIPLMRDKNVIVLLNKNDLETVVSEEDIYRLFEEFYPERKKPVCIRISLKDESGVDIFRNVVKEMFFHGEMMTNAEIIITNERHAEAFREAYDSLCNVKKSIENGMPEDFYSIDLMSAYSSLGRITGEEVGDDLANEIFSKFCMGK